MHIYHFTEKEDDVWSADEGEGGGCLAVVAGKSVLVMIVVLVLVMIMVMVMVMVLDDMLG